MPSGYLYRQDIFTLVYKFRDIELRWGFRSLGHSHFLAIDKHSSITRDRTKMKDNLFIIPIVRDIKSSSIAPYRIVIPFDKRRILWKRISNIGINRCIEAFKLPIRRNLYRRPVRIVKIYLVKILSFSIRMLDNIEFPLSIKTLSQFGFLPIIT